MSDCGRWLQLNGAIQLKLAQPVSVGPTIPSDISAHGGVMCKTYHHNQSHRHR
jgi:hypothetical protein